jgi:hypothetical protein
MGGSRAFVGGEKGAANSEKRCESSRASCLIFLESSRSSPGCDAVRGNGRKQGSCYGEERRSPVIQVSRFLQGAGWLLAFFLGGLMALWAAGALWFDLPGPVAGRKLVAGLFFGGLVFLLIFGKRRGRTVAAGAVAVVAGWWFTLRPSDDRSWQPDVARTAWAEVSGDEVMLHNVRNCEYRTATDFTPRWETRTVRLSQITGVDLGINYWDSQAMSHPLVSFQFADAPAVCFSIETRREVGEDYSAVGGFYRQYELIYIVADERDVLRVRTNYKGEDVHLYRLTFSPDEARGRFLEYLAALNALHEHPRWYNAATANCTTSIRSHSARSKRLPWDWRILISGYTDEMLYENGWLQTGGRSFPDLKKRALINEAARAANRDPDFSSRIRGHLRPFPP